MGGGFIKMVPIVGMAGALSALAVTALFSTMHAVVLPATRAGFPVLYANLAKRGRLADWRNYTVSFLFIVTASVWVTSIVALEGKSMDLMDSVSLSCSGLVWFMLGYCISDTIDMYRAGTLGTDMVFHHGVIIVAYGAAVLQGLYAPYLAASLVAETNTIFLHLRKLMQLAGVKRESLRYRVNLLLLLLGFPAQRVIPHLWLLAQTYKDRNRFAASWHFFVAFTGLFIINVLNFLLLKGILYADRKLIFSSPKFQRLRSTGGTTSSGAFQSAHAALNH